LSHGFDGLTLKLATGRPSLLNTEEKLALKKHVLSVAVKHRGDRLMGKDIQQHIKETYGVNYHVRNIYYLMKELNIVWITSRSKHPKQDLAAQEDFKKNF
jgi:transposase